MRALLVIGMQVDFLPLGAAEINGSETLLPVVNELMNSFELVIAANFSHPPQHKMFVANYPWRRPGQVIDLMGDQILLRNYYCVSGTFGAEPGMGLNAEQITHTIEMGVDKKLLPYSAFYDEHKKRATGLLAILQEKKVEEIVIAGMPLDEEIANSVVDAIDSGFKVIVPKNAVCAKDDLRKTEIFKSLAIKGASIIESFPTKH